MLTGRSWPASIILVRINKNYSIHFGARFAIEQIGFLGDQYITIYQQDAKGPILENGAEVLVEEPLNIERKQLPRGFVSIRYRACHTSARVQKTTLPICDVVSLRS